MERKNITREEVLLLVLIMKVVPMQWFYSLSRKSVVPQKGFPAPSGSKEERKRVYDLIYFLCKEGFLEIVTEVWEDRFLILTKKGFAKVNKPINGDPIADESLVTYKFARWSKAARRVPTIKLAHNYLTFRFMYEYLRSGQGATRIYTEYDQRHGKLGKKVIHYQNGYVRPDAIILPKGEDGNTSIIALEADTHAETQAEIYDKLIQYFLAVKHQSVVEDLEQLKLYFCFRTKKRMNFIFSEEKGKGIKKFFKDYCTFQKASKTASISMREIMKLLTEEKLKIFGGTYYQSLDNYKVIDFRELLIRQNERWKKS